MVSYMGVLRISFITNKGNQKRNMTLEYLGEGKVN